MRKACVLFFVIFASLTSFAQKRQNEIGAFAGVSYYIGDLNPAIQFLKPQLAFGGVFRHNFNNRLAVRAQGFYGKVTASDELSKENLDRNLNFESQIIEFGGQFEVNFFEYFIGSKKNFWTPYFFVGASGFLFNPKGVVNGELVELRSLRTEGQGSAYSNFSVAIPFGIGLKYSLNDYFGLGLEWGMRKTFTDYLDDVSTTYYLDNPDGTVIAQLASDPTLSHKKDMQRGNSKNNDWYSFAGILITVKFNLFTKEKCLDQEYKKFR